MEDNKRTNTPEHVNSPGRWRMVWPVFVCTSAFAAAMDSPLEISLKNFPYLAVMFFSVLLIAFVFWAILYAIDFFCLARLERWISEKLGTNSRWKKFVAAIIKLAVLFASMLVIFSFVNYLQPQL